MAAGLTGRRRRLRATGRKISPCTARGASSLDQLEHLTACAEASGGKPAKSPGAAVERYREVPLYEAALLTVDPSDDAPKSFE